RGTPRRARRTRSPPRPTEPRLADGNARPRPAPAGRRRQLPRPDRGRDVPAGRDGTRRGRKLRRDIPDRRRPPKPELAAMRPAFASTVVTGQLRIDQVNRVSASRGASPPGLKPRLTRMT